MRWDARLRPPASTSGLPGQGRRWRYRLTGRGSRYFAPRFAQFDRICALDRTELGPPRRVLICSISRQTRGILEPCRAFSFQQRTRYTKCGLSQTVNPLTVWWATFWIASQFSRPGAPLGALGFPQRDYLMRRNMKMCARASDLSRGIGLDGQGMDVCLHQGAQRGIHQSMAPNR